MSIISKITVSIIKWYLRTLIVIVLGYCYHFFFQHFFIKDDWYDMIDFNFCMFMIGAIINTLIIGAVILLVMLIIGQGVNWVFTTDKKTDYEQQP